MELKYRTTPLIIAVATAAVLATSAVQAQGPGKGGKKHDRPEFSEFDLDGDGAVTVAEMMARQAERFAAIDIDGDGIISADEHLQSAANRSAENAEAAFSRMLAWRDSDGDGGLSQQEIGDNRAEMMFSRLDTDGDGTISQEEFDQAGERHAGRGQGRQGKRKGG